MGIYTYKFRFCIYSKAYNKELFTCLKREKEEGKIKVTSIKSNFECFLCKQRYMIRIISLAPFIKAASSSSNS